MDFAFLIPAGTPAGSVKQSIDDIPASSVCTVTETINGSTSSVSAVVVGSGAQATVPAAGTASAELADTYSTVTTPPAPPAPVSPIVPRSRSPDKAAIVSRGRIRPGRRSRRTWVPTPL